MSLLRFIAKLSKLGFARLNKVIERVEVMVLLALLVLPLPLMYLVV